MADTTVPDLAALGSLAPLIINMLKGPNQPNPGALLGTLPGGQDLLNGVVGQQQQQAPLRQAVTQQAMNMLPNSAFPGGRPALSAVGPGPAPVAGGGSNLPGLLAAAAAGGGLGALLKKIADALKAKNGGSGGGASGGGGSNGGPGGGPLLPGNPGMTNPWSTGGPLLPGNPGQINPWSTGGPLLPGNPGSNGFTGWADPSGNTSGIAYGPDGQPLPVGPDAGGPMNPEDPNNAIPDWWTAVPAGGGGGTDSPWGD